jgi:hypothetical protein
MVTQVINCSCLRLLSGGRKLISPGAAKLRGLWELSLRRVPEYRPVSAAYSHRSHSPIQVSSAPVAPKVVHNRGALTLRVGNIWLAERTSRRDRKVTGKGLRGSSLTAAGVRMKRGVNSLRTGDKQALGEHTASGKTINCGLIRSAYLDNSVSNPMGGHTGSPAPLKREVLP